MDRMFLLLKRWSLLAPLLFCMQLHGQIIHNGPKTEEPFGAISYDSTSEEYSIYYASASLGSAARFDSTTTIERIVTDKDLQFQQVRTVQLPKLNGQFWQEIYPVEDAPELFILRSGSPDSLGNNSSPAWERQWSNLHLCSMDGDSAVLLRTLLPDSAFSVSYLGSEKVGDTLFLHLHYADGARDPGSHLGIVKYNLQTSTFSFIPELVIEQYFDFSDPSQNGVYEYHIKVNPIYLGNGDWVMMGHAYSDSIFFSLSCVITNPRADTAETVITFFSQLNNVVPKNSLWLTDDNLYICVSSDSIDLSNPILRFEEIPTIYTFNFQQDTIIDRKFLKAPDHDQNSTYVTGWVILPSEDYLLVSSLKKETLTNLNADRITLHVLDTLLNITNEVSLVDSVFQNMWGGFTGMIRDPRDPDSFVYCGAVTGGGYASDLDVFWGRIGGQSIGLEEPFEMFRLSLYPNPIEETLFLDIPEKLNATTVDYSLYSTTGVEIQTGQFEVENGLSVERLSPGNYVLQVELAKGNIVYAKFIKH